MQEIKTSYKVLPSCSHQRYVEAAGIWCKKKGEWVHTMAGYTDLCARCPDAHGSENEYFGKIDSDCILVEIDAKGYYYRFALTLNEFQTKYKKSRPDIPGAVEHGYTYTLRPMVHMWYMLTKVGSTEWCNFFTDMTWGLPQSDIEAGNIACVAEEEFGELLDAYREFDKGL